MGASPGTQKLLGGEAGGQAQEPCPGDTAARVAAGTEPPLCVTRPWRACPVFLPHPRGRTRISKSESQENTTSGPGLGNVGFAWREWTPGGQARPRPWGSSTCTSEPGGQRNPPIREGALPAGISGAGFRAQGPHGLLPGPPQDSQSPRELLRPRSGHSNGCVAGRILGPRLSPREHGGACGSWPDPTGAGLPFPHHCS